MINRAMIKSLSKMQLKGKWGIVGVLFLVLVVAIGLLSCVPGVGSLITLIIGGPITLTQVFIAFKVINSEELSLNDTISGFNNFVKALLLYLWQMLWVCLWSLLFVIPGIIKSISYSMAFYILAENPDMDIRDALKQSQMMTNGYKGQLFVLGLSFLGWNLLALLTCGIGYFWLIPYMQVTYANTYQFLKTHPFYVA